MNYDSGDEELLEHDDLIVEGGLPFNEGVAALKESITEKNESEKWMGGGFARESFVDRSPLEEKNAQRAALVRFVSCFPCSYPRFLCLPFLFVFCFLTSLFLLSVLYFHKMEKMKKKNGKMNI